MYMSSDPGGDGLRCVSGIWAYRALPTTWVRALPGYPFSKCMFRGRGKITPASVRHSGLDLLGGNLPLLDLVDQYAARCTFSCRGLRSTAGERVVEEYTPWGSTEHRRSRRCSPREGRRSGTGHRIVALREHSCR